MDSESTTVPEEKRERTEGSGHRQGEEEGESQTEDSKRQY